MDTLQPTSTIPNAPTFAQILENLEFAHSRYSQDYERCKEDARIRAGGKQAWEPALYKKRGKKAKDSINVIEKVIDRIVNPLRLNPIGMGLEGEQANPATQVLEADLKQIERSCTANAAYELAYDNEVSIGRGFLYVESDFINDESDEQTIVITADQDISSTFIDPLHQRVDGRDCRWGMRIKREKKEKGREYDSIAESTIRGKIAIGDDEVSVIQYCEVIEEKVKRFFLVEGGYFDEGDAVPFGSVIANSRVVTRKSLYVAKYCGGVLDYDTVLKGVPYINIIPCYGKRYLNERGQFDYKGVVFDARDVIRKVNLIAANETDLIAKAPKSQWKIARQQCDTEAGLRQWANANSSDSDALVYDAVGVGGQLIPPPERMDNSAQTQGLVASRQQAYADLVQVTGMYDSMFGGVDTTGQSGRALIARDASGELSTAHFLDNLGESIGQVTRVVLAMMPVVLVRDRDVEIVDENTGESRVVSVNWSTENVPWKKYRAVSSAGPAYESRRRESIDALTNIANSLPQELTQERIAITSSIIALQDFPEAKSLARLIKQRSMPAAPAPDPMMLEALETAKSAILEKDAQIDQLMGVVIQLQASVIDNQKDRDTQVIIKQMELDAQRDTNLQDNQTTLAKTQMEINAKQGIASEANKTKVLIEGAKLNEDAIAREDALAAKAMENPRPVVVIDSANLPPMVAGPQGTPSTEYGGAVEGIDAILNSANSGNTPI